MDIARVLRQVLDLWGSPPFTELPPEVLLDCANRCISARFLDLDLTPDACFVTAKSDTFTFASSTAREKDLSAIIDDVSRVSRVESRSSTSTNEDDWEEERVASFENWNDAVERGDGNFVSFYGTPPALTMVVNRDVSAYMFRIVYRQLAENIKTPSEVVDLPSIYEPVLVYDIALEAGELIDNQSPEFMQKKASKMQYLAMRRDDSLKRIDKWRRSQRGTGPTTRRPFNDRAQILNTGRRRFTVNF